MKTQIIILALIFLSLFSIVATAQEEAKPGDFVEFKITNLEISTKGWPVVGIVTGGWKPAFVKWYLVDPYGHIVYMIDRPIDSVTQIPAGIGELKWSISSDVGLVEIPAFASYGMWTMNAKFYDVNSIGFITWSNSQSSDNLAPIFVGNSGIVESLSAPIYVYWNIAGFEISFALPDLIFLILIAVIIIVLILNIRAFVKRRK